MTNRRERIIEVAARVATLRIELRAAEEEMDRLLPPEPDEPAQSTGMLSGLLKSHGLLEEVESGSGPAMSSMIIALLEAHPDQAFDVADIACSLNLPNHNSIRGTLARLAAGGRIRKAERGRYTANEERPYEPSSIMDIFRAAPSGGKA